MKRGRGGEDRWSGGSLGGEERRGEGKVEKRAEARRRGRGEEERRRGGDEKRSRGEAGVEEG